MSSKSWECIVTNLKFVRPLIDERTVVLNKPTLVRRDFVLAGAVQSNAQSAHLRRDFLSFK